MARTYVTVLRGDSPRTARTILASADEAVVEATLRAIRERAMPIPAAAAGNSDATRDLAGDDTP